MSVVVEIFSAERAEEEALMKVMQLVHRHQNLAAVDVFVESRQESGWLEYIIVMKYLSGAKLTIGLIQRSKGAEWETHT